MSENHKSDSSTSESEIDPFNSNFNPIKALYSTKTIIPDEKAPLYDNINQFESAQAGTSIIPIGHRDLVIKREAEKERIKLQAEKELEEKNKQRFSQYQGLTAVPRREFRVKNVLTRLPNTEGPLSVLKDCVDRRIRIKVVTRNATGVRGQLYANLLAFDKQWNLALSDVLEVWKRKSVNKRKVIPSTGLSVPQGSAAKLFPVPKVTETPLGKGIWECTRHIPQLMMRGEHVVLIQVVER